MSPRQLPVSPKCPPSSKRGFSVPTSSVTEVSSKLETRTRQLVHMQAKVIDAQNYICCSHVSILHSVKRTQDSPLCITVCGLFVRMHCSVMLHFTVYHSLFGVIVRMHCSVMLHFTVYHSVALRPEFVRMH